MKVSHPYAMVIEGSKEHKKLLGIRWSVTDRYQDWLHMEPPLI